MKTFMCTVYELNSLTLFSYSLVNLIPPWLVWAALYRNAMAAKDLEKRKVAVAARR
jgi:hypothetical protein